jgi:hypothetical protein
MDAAALMSVTFTPSLSRWRMIHIDDDGFISDLVNAHGSRTMYYGLELPHPNPFN